MDSSEQNDREFVGRQKERDAFARILANPNGSDRVMFIWGPGGIGKTKLLKLLVKNASDNNKFLVADKFFDMYSTSNRDIEGVVKAIVYRLSAAKAKKQEKEDSLQEQEIEREIERSFHSYKIARDELDEAYTVADYASSGMEVKRKEMLDTFRHCLKALCKEQPIVLAFDTFEHVQGTLLGDWILSQDELQMPGLVCIIASRQPDPFDETQLALAGFTDEQAIQLAELLPEHARIPKDDVLKLAEKIGRNPLLLKLAIWVMSSESEPKKIFAFSQLDFERWLVSWLNPTGFEGRTGLVVSPDIRLSHPARQALICMAYLNRRFNKEMLERLVSGRYITGGSSDQIWDELTINLPEFFFAKERPEGEFQLHDRLAEMIRLHILPDAFDDQTGSKLKQFARDAVAWYDDFIKKGGSPFEKAIFKVEKLAYVLQLEITRDFLRQPENEETDEGDRLVWLLPPNYREGLALLEQYQSEHADVLGRLIVNEFESGEIANVASKIVKRFPTPDEQYKAYALLGQIATDAYLRDHACRYWDRAITVAVEDQQRTKQIEAMVNRHNNTWQRDLLESVTILKEALQLCEQYQVGRWHPTVLYELGFTYTELQNLEEAVQWYEQALKMAGHHKDRDILPTILNDMGYNYLLMGDYGRARAHITQARELRELNRNQFQQALEAIDEQLQRKTADAESLAEKRQLEKEMRDAQQKIGMSYNTLGQLARYTGDIARANGYYAEALETFEEIGDHNWQAITRYSRGDAHRILAMNLFNQGRKPASERYENRAKEDLEKSLNLIQQYGFVELEDLANRHMGRLVHDQALRLAGDPERRLQLLHEAREFFARGLKVARQTNDPNEELENLTEIAFLTDDLVRAYKERKRGRQLNRQEEVEVKSYLKQLDEGLEKYRQAGRQTHQFPVFENLLEIEKAAYAYELNNVAEALELYVDGFTGLASNPGYGSARCRAHFDHLFRNIRRLPEVKQQVDWCQQFMERWRTTDMTRGEPKTVAAAHPDLYERFEIHATTAFIYAKDESVE